MKNLFYILTLAFFVTKVNAQVHPITFYNKTDINYLRQSLKSQGLLQQSFQQIKSNIDLLLNTDIDVPVPKDPAGGYTHDQHKENYMTMFQAACVYQLTGDVKYAQLVKKMFLKYSALNPTLVNHPQATSGTPGRIFWQALNDANWLVFTGMAYDGIESTLTAQEKKLICYNAFAPIISFFTNDLKNWYDRLHNHSVWACAGVGIVGIATDNKEYVALALSGVDKTKNAGFLQQMNQLFSPDGYYTEGPYYVRYAILPYMLFANALAHYQPSLKIFDYRNQILKKALYTCLQQTNTDGSFFPLNDAIKEKDYTSNELVNAIAIAAEHYGITPELNYVAQKHGRVILSRGGAMLSAHLKQNRVVQFPYTTIESTDGAKGESGGVSVLRLGKSDSLTSVIFKYASQGMGHGHFDRLNVNVFDRGNEIITDYGSARFIGIEQKYGGRYLKENTSYAAQTVAHNTVVMDEQSHFNGDSDKGELTHAERLFSRIGSKVQVVAAQERHAYAHTNLQRFVYTMNLPGVSGRTFVFDVFKIANDSVHQYDIPFPYNGQMISTSFQYKSLATPKILGSKNGYEHLWQLAYADSLNQQLAFTFLNKRRFYTIHSLLPTSGSAHLLQVGANDPNFNLRREQTYLLRCAAKNPIFFNVLEMHGSYDPIFEFSKEAYAKIKHMSIKSDAEYLYISATINDKQVQIIQALNNFEKTSTHQVTVEQRVWKWQGPVLTIFDKNKID